MCVQGSSDHGNVFPNESHAFWTERFTEAKEQYGMGAFWNDHMAENMDQCVSLTPSSALSSFHLACCCLRMLRMPLRMFRFHGGWV